MKSLWSVSTCVALVVLSFPTSASDFYRLDQALPANVDVASIAPVFDFDGDGCLPSAGISRSGQQNAGLRPTGNITGDCRSFDFLESSNTMHRHACETINGNVYCGHFFSLYFEKDQIFSFFIANGHRHDWEHAAVWATNGIVTHGSYSAHGDLYTKPASQLPFQNGHLKIVYHKDGPGTHAFRFAKNNEVAENPYGNFVTPLIASWYEVEGDGIGNGGMRNRLNRYDYGSATLPIKDNKFLNNLNIARPSGYPLFVDSGSNNSSVEYVQLINNASGLCMDIEHARMVNGTNVIQWHCNGSAWQAWSYNSVSGEIRSKHDPSFCLDNGNVWGNGASIEIWRCNGGEAQRYNITNNGAIKMRELPSQVLDGYGTDLGDNIGTWNNWGGANQRWIKVSQ